MWDSLSYVICNNVFDIMHDIIIHNFLQIGNDRSNGFHKFLGIHGCRTARNWGGYRCGGSGSISIRDMIKKFKRTLGLVG